MTRSRYLIGVDSRVFSLEHERGAQHSLLEVEDLPALAHLFGDLFALKEVDGCLILIKLNASEVLKVES